MTQDEANRVAQALRSLDQFAANAPLGRNWHRTWEQIFTQVIQQIVNMVDKPAEEKPDDPKK